MDSLSRDLKSTHERVEDVHILAHRRLPIVYKEKGTVTALVVENNIRQRKKACTCTFSTPLVVIACFLDSVQFFTNLTEMKNRELEFKSHIKIFIRTLWLA